MDSKSRPKVLWHNLYSNGPINGFALYNDQKVWFECVEKGGYLNCDELIQNNEEIQNVLKKCKKLKIKSKSTEIDTLNFRIELNMEIYKKRKFVLYKLPTDILNTIEENHKIWQNTVGFGKDHDPNVYKIFDSSKANIEEYKRLIKPLGKRSEDDYEIIGYFYSDDFDHYDLPKLGEI